MGKINKIQEVEIVYKRPVNSSLGKIACSKDISEVFRLLIDEERIDYKEFFLVALLSRNNGVLGVSEISKGSISGSVVNIIEILQLAIKTNASSVVLCHNHPSGSLKPSESDISLTTKVKEACKFFDISLLDHVILTSEGYFSFADDGLI